ncbi:cytochrome c3 family protein [Granulicella sibirica]|uniref:Chaperone protein HtpG n=1 Tax=Granulicella sibirica TaxID=2479048 RepID=A0A4Q0T472_9BACT|nr:cytochrome c3 family protein [Granulicella sibirica]RXH58525.1 chaperone protein HtpG [Granulicella sibirica]
MAQVFDRSSNALARMSLVLTGLIVIALGVALDQLQRSPWVTKQGQRPDQPIPFSHKHHVEGLGLQCQYCHTSVEKSSYAGIPPTKTCINCHSQIWTNAALLEPVRQSWATGASVQWIKVHDLPDYVYFNHSIHVNKGIGCASCHGRVDEMPLMYQQNTLQMEWCLNCHRNPAVNLRPTSEIYNMAWAGPSTDKPVWCGSTGKGGPTAQSVACTTVDPSKGGPEVAMLQAGTKIQPHPISGEGQTVTDGPPAGTIAMPISYQKFTSQIDLGHYLVGQYHIRTPNELASCEVCHR